MSWHTGGQAARVAIVDGDDINRRGMTGLLDDPDSVPGVGISLRSTEAFMSPRRPT